MVTPPNAGENEEKLDNSYAMGGNENGPATLEKLGIF